MIAIQNTFVPQCSLSSLSSISHQFSAKQQKIVQNTHQQQKCASDAHIITKLYHHILYMYDVADTNSAEKGIGH